MKSLEIKIKEKVLKTKKKLLISNAGKKVELEIAKLNKNKKGELVWNHCSCETCPKKLGKSLGKNSKWGFRYYCKNFDCHNLHNSKLEICQDCREKYFGMKKRELNKGSSEYYQCDECSFEIRIGDHAKPYGWAERNVMKFGLNILRGANVSMRFTKDYEERVEKVIKKHEKQTGHNFYEEDENEEETRETTELEISKIWN